MARYLRKKKKKPVGRILILVAVVLALAACAVFFVPQLLYSMSGGEEEEISLQTEPKYTEAVVVETTEETIPTAPTVPTVAFPLSVDDGRLEISSLFQYSGINPDCDGQEGTDIASIVLKNVSGMYLAEANISLTLLDDTQLNFKVTELPDGESVMAFSTENLSIPVDAACLSAECEASYDPTAVADSDQVTASVDGARITLTNISDQDISQIVVYCRDVLGDDYFGGTTYLYTVTDLPAGESTVVEATDCILGMAEVVRFVVN